MVRHRGGRYEKIRQLAAVLSTMVRLGAIWEAFGRGTTEDQPMRPNELNYHRENSRTVEPARSTSTTDQGSHNGQSRGGWRTNTDIGLAW